MNPVVSICCITYNHEDFIRMAIEGFLMQRTSFPIEILIHDDASTDNTASIIKEYENAHPHIIKPIYQKTNKYSEGKSISLTYQFPRALGKYIAICEGDDYWTDPYKLQKQVDFLEHNTDFVICSHNHSVLINGELIPNKKWYKENQTLLDLAKDINFNTLSVIFRKDVLNLAEYATAGVNFSNFLFMYLTQFGKLHHFNETMAVYRIHSKGMWGGKSIYERSIFNISTLVKIIGFFNNNKDVSSTLKEKYTYRCLNYSIQSFKILNFNYIFNFIRISFKYGVRKTHFFFPFNYFYFRLLK